MMKWCNGFFGWSTCPGVIKSEGSHNIDEIDIRFPTDKQVGRVRPRTAAERPRNTRHCEDAVALPISSSIKIGLSRSIGQVAGYSPQIKLHPTCPAKPGRRSGKIAFLALMAGLFIGVDHASASDSSDFTAIRCDAQMVPPEWALLERHLIETLNRAGVEFYNTYVAEDGTVRYKERYEGGMNSSDDLYEGFKGFSLHTALGGSEELNRLHLQAWEGITRQFTRYGQIYREFDSNWDWMHHGEGYVDFYTLGFIQPEDALFRDRSVRFAAMFTGEDPEAPNWDPELKQMRASMTGSRGPKMEWTKRDWIPTNANLVYRHLPFTDIPGVDTTTAWINDHPENDVFAKVVKVMSDRMAKGDIPLNLTATPLIANAFFYTGDEKYVQWVKDYVNRWEELTEKNNGITPDNVGLSGEIGEYNNGNWWGGYYGWYWVSGGSHIIRAELTSGKVATLLTGDTRWMDLPRSQLAMLRKHGKVTDGEFSIPIRYNEDGWHHFRRESPSDYLHLWFMSQSDGDWDEIERLTEARQQSGGRITDEDLEWAQFIKGKNPGFAERALSRDLKTVIRKIEFIQKEHGDPETFVDNKWILVDPMQLDSLVRLSVGGLPVKVQGEILYSQVRYFDGERKRTGLPPDVAALVTHIEKDWLELEVINLHAAEPRQLVIQGGAYGEHRFESVEFTQVADIQPPVRDVRNPRGGMIEQALTQNSMELDSRAFTVNLAPGSGSKLRIKISRYASNPSFDFPWNR
ncbi:MAG: hypothetical protein O3C20_13175 [Verrucomicrobia bacterium]|nr:hypothetical protein [Verrucomicrobiota bacterium]